MGVQVVQEEPAPTTLRVDPSTNIASSTMDPAMYFAAKEGDVRYLSSLTESGNLSSFLTPQKNTVLHIAVKFLQAEFAAQVLRSDPSLLFQPNSKGDTPLHVAARYDNKETVRLLVSNYREHHQQQGDLESGGSTPNNNIPITAEWMRATNSDGNTALHEALMNKSPDIALMLLEKDPGLASCENNAMESPLYLSASSGFYDVVKRILDINVAAAAGMTTTAISLRGRNGQTPLHAIAMFREKNFYLERTKAIARLLCEKMPIEAIRQQDEFGRTALHYSVAAPNPEVTRILLRKDHTLAYLPDKDGRIPLFIAATLSHRPIVNIILKYCPDCGESRDHEDQNVFHFLMANRKHVALLTVMKHPELKGLLNESNGDGNTLLHLAAEAQHFPALDFLLECEGINLDARNRDGLTALDLFQNWKPFGTSDNVLKEYYVARFGDVHDRTRHLGGIEDGRKNSSHGVAGGGETTQEIGVEVGDGTQLNNFANTLIVVATLFASITFSALFQLPGGYSSDPPYLGAALFGKSAAFMVFLLSDTIALSLSLLSIFSLVSGMSGLDNKRLQGVVALNLEWLYLTLVATVVAFTTAAYLVTEPKSKSLAISILVIGCSAPILINGISGLFARNEYLGPSVIQRLINNQLIMRCIITHKLFTNWLCSKLRGFLS